MRFENIATGKENTEYFSGDVLILYNESVGKSGVYMVITRHDVYYNLIDLNRGITYFFDFEFYDDFVKKLEKLFIFIKRINNDELELVRVKEA